MIRSTQYNSQALQDMRLVTRQLFSFSKIGFVGLGNMGLPMAANLASKGHQVFGNDADANKANEVSSKKITFKQLKDLTKEAEIFITMLPNTEHSYKVCESPEGIFKNAKKGSLIIDCSTISPMAASDLNKKAKQFGMTYVDAPVSGGVTGAAAGTLTFMVGAENQNVFNQCKPILEGMGKNFFNCGKSSGGQIAKLCNNMSLAIQMIGIAQSLAIGKKLGMDENILAKVMSVSSARCWSVDTYNPIPGYSPNAPAGRQYEGGFACDLMLKDLKLALEAAEAAHVNASLGSKSKQIYQNLSNSGKGRKDFGVIYDEILKAKK